MNYTLTLINDAGVMLEQQVSLPVEDTITWADFVSLRSVRDCLLLHPTMRLIDVTPGGMPDTFTDEQSRELQLTRMGLRKSTTTKGAPQYEHFDADIGSDSDV